MRCICSETGGQTWVKKRSRSMVLSLREAPGATNGARRWVPEWDVNGVPYNYMVPGYRNGRVNTLRLWSARATQEFDLKIFNSGDYADAVAAQTQAENISKVLYPEDSTPQGKEHHPAIRGSSWLPPSSTTSSVDPPPMSKMSAGPSPGSSR